MSTDREQKPRTPRNTKPLSVFAAAEKMCDLIASHPSADEIAKRIQGEVAGAHARKQIQLDAIAALVPESERDKLPGVILARLDKDGLRGFAVMAQENDAAPENGGEIPARLLTPLDEKRLAMGKGQ